jgi:hypothetical protein
MKTTEIKKPASKSGQAIVEFVVGLVGLLMLVAFIIQFGEVGWKHTQALIDARETAGRHAMSDDHSAALPGPRFIQDWDIGPDESRYSQDDEAILSSDGFVQNSIVRHARPDDLGRYVPDNQISALNGGGTINSFGFVHGNQTSEPVTTMPIIRHLLLNTPSIQLEADVWMTWTKGIY